MRRGKNTPLFTEKQETYIDAVAAGAKPVHAAKLANYAVPAVTGPQLLREPHIAEEITKRQKARMTCELLPLALDTLARVMRTGPAGPAVQASKIVIDHSFGEANPDGKPPHLMTADEVQESIEALRRRAADLAQPIIEGTLAQAESPPAPVKRAGLFA